jgi:hypothetical protein
VYRNHRDQIGQDDEKWKKGKEACAEIKLVSYNEQRAKKKDCKEVEAWRMT